MKRTVNHPTHLAGLARLTAAVAVVAGLRQRNSELENAPPNGVGKVFERLVPDATGLAERDAQSKRLVDGLAFDPTAAKRAGFNGQGAENQAIIKSIGAKIAAQMH